MVRKPARKATDEVFSLKISLRGAKPPIWRRLLAPTTMTLEDLHEAIQVTMGWTGGHLHIFEIDGRQFGEAGEVEEVEDETRQTLGRLFDASGGRFLYTYDFGDNWEHVVQVEKRLPAAPVLSPQEVVAHHVAVDDDCRRRAAEVLPAFEERIRPMGRVEPFDERGQAAHDRIGVLA